MSQWSANDSELTVQAGNEEEPLEKKKPSELWEWTKSIGTALVIVLIIHFFIFNLSTVKGQSMEPTLIDGEWLFINKIGYLIGGPDRGDIVILKDPNNNLGFREFLVKRIVGLPGETVEVSNGKLYIDSIEQNEPFTNIEIQDGSYGPVVIPEGEFFVMGDNRHRLASTDSRIFGTVPEKLIKGKAQFVMWPVDKIGGLYGTLPEE